MRKNIKASSGRHVVSRFLKGGALLLLPGMLLGWTAADPPITAGYARADILASAPMTPLLERSSGFVETRLVFVEGSRLWVEGGSTVRGWSCETPDVTGSVVVDDAASSTSVAHLSGQVRQMEVTVPVATLECGNDTMNRHMLDALKAKDHANIRFTMSRSEVVADGSAGTATLEGTLRIAGQDQPVVLIGAVTDGENGQLLVTGSHELNMTAYGIRPPRLMLGTMRVHEDVVVHYELVMNR